MQDMRYTLGDTPFSQPLSLRQMMDRLVEHAFVAPPGPTGQEGVGGGPALNAYDEGDHVVVEAQLPGMKPADIDVSIEQGVLTIQGETKAKEEREAGAYLLREHRIGRFSRSLRLPETVDPDAVHATYEDGVLRLTLPKAEQTKPHRIRVEAGGRQSANGAQGSEQGTKGPAKTGAPGRSS
jgi:HSP20 family protein